MTDMKKVLFPTQKLDVLVDDAISGKRKVFNSRVEDIQENGLVIAAPYSQGYFLPPTPGRELSARVTADNCAFLFKIKLHQHVNAPVALWTVSWPTDVERVQMRSYVRIDINLDAILTNLDEQEARPIATMTKDISAGGLRALMATPLPVGTTVNVKLHLEGEDILESIGEVVRIIKPKSEHEKYAVAIKYYQISEKDRSQVIKFIYRKQIERRKKQQEIFED